jgi:hypothetical protein
MFVILLETKENVEIFIPFFKYSSQKKEPGERKVLKELLQNKFYVK